MTPEEIEILEQARVYVNWEAENSDPVTVVAAATLLNKIDDILDRYRR